MPMSRDVLECKRKRETTTALPPVDFHARPGELALQHARGSKFEVSDLGLMRWGLRRRAAGFRVTVPPEVLRFRP